MLSPYLQRKALNYTVILHQQLAWLALKHGAWIQSKTAFQETHQNSRNPEKWQEMLIYIPPVMKLHHIHLNYLQQLFMKWGFYKFNRGSSSFKSLLYCLVTKKEALYPTHTLIATKVHRICFFFSKNNLPPLPCTYQKNISTPSKARCKGQLLPVLASFLYDSAVR